jgi:hypothetical protein
MVDSVYSQTRGIAQPALDFIGEHARRYQIPARASGRFADA